MYPQLADDQMAMLLTYMSIIFIFFILIIINLSYVLSALGLKKIADKNNVKHSWLSWIPVANNYIYGKIAFKSNFRAILFTIFGTSGAGVICSAVIYSIFTWYLTFSPYNYFTDIFASITGLIYFLLPFITYVLLFIATYKIYKKIRPVFRRAFSLSKNRIQ